MARANVRQDTSGSSSFLSRGKYLKVLITQTREIVLGQRESKSQSATQKP
jgi:hypothetical protein